MPTYWVSFTKEITVSVEAKNLDELKAAAKATAEDGLYGWDPPNEWDWSAFLMPQKPSEFTPDCGLVEGQILDYSDYLKDIAKENE